MAGLRLLTIAPRVSEVDGQLRARTGRLLTILSLGLISREVVVDRRSRYVTLVDRWLWFFRRTRTIPFKHIHRIEYDYEATATSFARGFDRTVRSGDEIESYRVGLVLRARTDVPDTHAHLYEERVPLFGFHGDGRGQLFGPSLEGQQQSRSRSYVERIRALTGAGFGHELPTLTDELGQTWRCHGCGREGPPRKGQCYYCGGDLEPRAV